MNNSLLWSLPVWVYKDLPLTLLPKKLQRTASSQMRSPYDACDRDRKPRGEKSNLSQGKSNLSQGKSNLSLLDPKRYPPNQQLNQLLEPLNKRKADQVMSNWGTIPIMAIVMLLFLFFLVIITQIYNGSLLFESVAVTW
jgi:hypothetical protein